MATTEDRAWPSVMAEASAMVLTAAVQARAPVSTAMGAVRAAEPTGSRQLEAAAMVRVHLEPTVPEVMLLVTAVQARLRLRRVIWEMPVRAAPSLEQHPRRITLAADKFRRDRQCPILAPAAKQADRTARAGRNSCANGLRWRWGWDRGVPTEASKAR